MLESTCGMVGNTLLMPGDVSSEVIIAIVNFMYTGSIKIDSCFYEGLLKSSKDMKLTALTKLLEAHRPEPEPEDFEAVPIKFESEQGHAINLEPLEIPIKKEPMDPLDDDLGRYDSSPDNSKECAKPKRKKRKIYEQKEKHLCSDCEKAFKTKADLRYHVKQVHTNSCVVCHRIFEKQSDFDAHDLQACIMTQQTICTQCSKVFRSKDSLNAHIQSVHVDANEGYTKKCKVEGNDESDGDLTPNCSSRLAKSDNSWKEACEHCERLFKTRKSLRQHVKVKHLQSIFFQCSICEKKFGAKHHLKYHMKHRVCSK